MVPDQNSRQSRPESVELPSDGCPLIRSDQTRNLLVFASCKGLIYLAAPVLYVGVQGAVCNWLGASNTVANLPKVAFLSMTVTPVLVAWYFPYVAYLKRNLVTCFSIAMGTLATVAVVLISSAPPVAKIAVVILDGAVCGAALPTADALIWEMMGRGVAESRRGLALSLAFGVGPVLAALSSLVTQLLLKDELRSAWLPNLAPPLTFAVLFGAATPMMAVAAFLCSRCVVPLLDQELSRAPFRSGVFGGLRDFMTDRVLLTAAIVTVLVYTGNTIDPNMNLYTPDVLGAAPEQYAGLQLFLRFGFKAVAGLLLGWLLTRTHPKAGVLITACTYAVSLVWAMLVTGKWYLVAFGIYGAGELIGVYAPNYILSASRKSQMRRNMAFVTMLMAPAAPAGALFGWISDHFGTAYNRVIGFKLSFAVCAAIMLAGILLAAFALPARPTPGREDSCVPN